MKDNISIICVPFSIGGPSPAACDGPSALLKAGLVDDLHEIGYKTKIIYPQKKLLSYKGIAAPKFRKNSIVNLKEIIEVNSWLSEIVKKEIKSGSIPLTIGGDHSLAIGTISGVRDIYKDIGVIWIDRHFDAHSPKNTVSWRAHGMPVAVAIGDKKSDLHPDFQALLNIGKCKKLPKIKKENFVQIGMGEKSKNNPKTKWYSMEDIDNLGINKIIEKSFDYLLKRVKYVYIAWDIDSMNVTGTGTSGDGQLTLREGLVIARAINKKIREKGRLAGFEMMEVAPKLEKPFLGGQTVDWALQITTTVFGDNLFNNYSKMTRNINMHA